MTDCYDPMKEFREQQERMEELFDPMKKIRERLDPMKKFREQQELIEEIMRPVNLFDPIKMDIPDFDNGPLTRIKLLEDRERWLNISEALSIPKNNDLIGFIEDEENYDLDELSRELKDISSSSSNYSEFSNRIKAWYESLPSGVRFVVFYLLLPYIVSVVAGAHTPFWTGVWNDYSDLPERVAKKEIIKDVTEVFDVEELREHRFTTASKLNVRESGGMKSEILDILMFGAIVRVVDKSKAWTLVEYGDVNNQEIKQGWVFSRYLEKFKK